MCEDGVILSEVHGVQPFCIHCSITWDAPGAGLMPLSLEWDTVMGPREADGTRETGRGQGALRTWLGTKDVQRGGRENERLMVSGQNIGRIHPASGESCLFSSSHWGHWVLGALPPQE